MEKCKLNFSLDAILHHALFYFCISTCYAHKHVLYSHVLTTTQKPWSTYHIISYRNVFFHIIAVNSKLHYPYQQPKQQYKDKQLFSTKLLKKSHKFCFFNILCFLTEQKRTLDWGKKKSREKRKTGLNFRVLSNSSHKVTK